MSSRASATKPGAIETGGVRQPAAAATFSAASTVGCYGTAPAAPTPPRREASLSNSPGGSGHDRTTSGGGRPAGDLFEFGGRQAWAEATRRVHSRRGIEPYRMRLAEARASATALLRLELGRVDPGRDGSGR